MQDDNKIFLIDGYAQIYRGFYGVRGLTNAKGEPTNALYAIARLIDKIDKEYPCSYCAFVMDKGKSKHRTEIHPEYKATRKPMPDELRSQIPLIKEWVEAAGWTIIEDEGQEADDLIGAIAEVREDKKVYFASQDKDLAQLINDNVIQLLSGNKGTFLELDPEGVKNKFGVTPDQIVDYLSLLGDSSDNIPGVPKVGVKTAVSLLEEYGDVKTILENCENIKRKAVKENLANSKEILELNNKLISLDKTLPDYWNGLDTIRRKEKDYDKLIALSEAHNFKSMTDKLKKDQFDARNPTLF